MTTISRRVARRIPAEVMRLSRLGTLHQCRLSFMRVLTRRLARDQWKFERSLFDIDGDGVGRAVYTARGTDRSYSFVAFAHDLPDALRSDRVIAEAWDATFALHDGVISTSDLNRLERNVPLQEAGRVTERELVLSRANRSVRLWRHVVEALASGSQPDPALVDRVGYLMRTTAVYGSGKFGAVDREMISARPELRAPFQAEMLSVYLIRTFVRDLVEHMARQRGGGRAARLDPEISRRMGIGNSTGLGMAPFIINHPVLFNNWIMAREEAIALVRSVEMATSAEVAIFVELLARSEEAVRKWRTAHPRQAERVAELDRDLESVRRFIRAHPPGNDHHPWDKLMAWAAEALSEEGQELLASLILEPYGEIVDELVAGMSDDDAGTFAIDGEMTVSDIRSQIEETFGWALALDWEARENRARVWYVSEEKLEPRLGERFEEPIGDFEQPLAPARDAVAAYADLASWEGKSPIAEFLSVHGEHRHVVRRTQMCRNAPYGEIRDNTISAALIPLDMLRAKLSFFGATRFDPRSDRWIRICMFAGAPHPEELSYANADLWVYDGSGM